MLEDTGIDRATRPLIRLSPYQVVRACHSPHPARQVANRRVDRDRASRLHLLDTTGLCRSAQRAEDKYR